MARPICSMAPWSWLVAWSPAAAWLRGGRLAGGRRLDLADQPVRHRIDRLTEPGKVALWYCVERLRLARLPSRKLAQLALGDLMVGAARRGLQQERDDGRGLVPRLAVDRLRRPAGGGRGVGRLAHAGIADIDDVAGLEVLPPVELQRLHDAGKAVLVEPTGRGARRLDILDLAQELVMVRRVGQGCEDLGRVLDGGAVVAKADQAEAHLDRRPATP